MFAEYFVFVIISFFLKTLYPMHRNTSNFSSPGHFQTACQSGYSQSASLLAHNRIAASQLIRSGLYHSWYKQVPTHCLLLFAIEAGDLLDSVKVFLFLPFLTAQAPYISEFLPNTAVPVRWPTYPSWKHNRSSCFPLHEAAPRGNHCRLIPHR